MKTIIAFNGPPKCGKSLARYLSYGPVIRNTADPCMNTAFSDSLYDAIQSFYGIPDTVFYDLKESHKDEQSDWLFGKTLRDVCINLSEDWAKPYHNDKGIFAKILANKTKGVNVVIDTGFPDELYGFVEESDEPCRVCLIRLTRNGCSFTNDSRSYITEGDIEEFQKMHGYNNIYKVYDVVNNNSMNYFETTLERILDSFFKSTD